VKKKSTMLLIVFIIALTLCGTAAAANTSYGINIANSSLFEIVLTAIAFIGIGAACSKSGKSHGGDFDFDSDDSSWDDGGFDGFDGGD
jgi:hypothetical protein